MSDGRSDGWRDTEGSSEMEGLIEGSIELVGPSVGDSEGTPDGFIDTDGCVEGVWDGRSEGCRLREGVREGLVDGPEVGFVDIVGTKEGISDGVSEGSQLIEVSESPVWLLAIDILLNSAVSFTVTEKFPPSSNQDDPHPPTESKSSLVCSRIAFKSESTASSCVIDAVVPVSNVFLAGCCGSLLASSTVVSDPASHCKSLMSDIVVVVAIWAPSVAGTSCKRRQGSSSSVACRPDIGLFWCGAMVVPLYFSAASVRNRVLLCMLSLSSATSLWLLMRLMMKYGTRTDVKVKVHEKWFEEDELEDVQLLRRGFLCPTKRQFIVRCLAGCCLSGSTVAGVVVPLSSSVVDLAEERSQCRQPKLEIVRR